MYVTQIMERPGQKVKWLSEEGTSVSITDTHWLDIRDKHIYMNPLVPGRCGCDFKFVIFHNMTRSWALLVRQSTILYLPGWPRWCLTHLVSYPILGQTIPLYARYRGWWAQAADPINNNNTMKLESRVDILKSCEIALRWNHRISLMID